jgi:hypothetical protein
MMNKTSFASDSGDEVRFKRKINLFLFWWYLRSS